MCSGACVATPPLGWEGPALLWLGADGNAPVCPSNAPIGASLAHADLRHAPRILHGLHVLAFLG